MFPCLLVIVTLNLAEPLSYAVFSKLTHTFPEGQVCESAWDQVFNADDTWQL